MKEEKAITLVTLVVTIIVLIILAGVSLNATLGDNGIITQAQKAKENMELARVEEEEQLNSLYEELAKGGEGIFDDSMADAIEKLENFRKVIATAITNEGVSTTETDTTETMAENISKILQERTKDATATSEDIAEGKTAYVNGEKITGVVKKGYKVPSIEVGAGYNYNTENRGSSKVKIESSNFNNLHIGSIVASGLNRHATANFVIVYKIIDDTKEEIWRYTIANVSSCSVTDIEDINISGAEYIQIYANINSAGGSTDGILTIEDVTLY